MKLALLFLASPALALSITDLRDLKATADTPEQHARAQWLAIDGQSLGGAFSPNFSHSMAANSDSEGGPGSSTASAHAQQVSFIGDNLFSGSVSAQAQAQATASSTGWGYFGHGAALSVFDVSFAITTPTAYQFVGQGMGDVAAQLVGFWSFSDFSNAAHSGVLEPGQYEFRFLAGADAMAGYSRSWTLAGDSAAGDFTFSLGAAKALAVPETGSTAVLLMLGFVLFAGVDKDR